MPAPFVLPQLGAASFLVILRAGNRLVRALRPALSNAVGSRTLSLGCVGSLLFAERAKPTYPDSVPGFRD
jgi:hypothetical protein